AARVQPPQEILKMDVDGKGFGFVDQSPAGGESEDENGSASTMWICQPSSRSGEHAQPAVGFSSESRLDGSPVGTQTLEQLEADVYPAMRLLEQQPRQHRILAKKRPRPLRLVEAFDEAVES